MSDTPLKQSFSAIRSRLEKKINLLIVDDDPRIATHLSRLFTSPLYKTVVVHSYHQAIAGIPALNGNWHAWIIDIDLGEDHSGLDILQAYAMFPFKLVLSGLRSMDLATRALESGAKKAIDKNPGSLTMLFNETCALSTLGFLLRGRSTKYYDLFSLLADTNIRTVQQWAHRACITPRQLSRICGLHGSLSPFHWIAHYHTIRLLLENRVIVSREMGRSEDDGLRNFYAECLDFSSRYADDFNELLVK